MTSRASLASRSGAEATGERTKRAISLFFAGWIASATFFLIVVATSFLSSVVVSFPRTFSLQFFVGRLVLLFRFYSRQISWRTLLKGGSVSPPALYISTYSLTKLLPLLSVSFLSTFLSSLLLLLLFLSFLLLFLHGGLWGNILRLGRPLHFYSLCIVPPRDVE